MYIYTHRNIYIYTHISIHIYRYINLYIYLCISICLSYSSFSLYISLSVYLYIYPIGLFLWRQVSNTLPQLIFYQSPQSILYSSWAKPIKLLSLPCSHVSFPLCTNFSFALKPSSTLIFRANFCSLVKTQF